MKKTFLLFLIVCFILAGCTKTESDINGVINEVDHNRILVEDREKGLIWISLPKNTDSKIFETGQTVAVWTDGQIRESYPMQATSLKIEILAE